ncbi:uncharacterized protein LOC135502042 isoform X2 [Lineus longissimus]|uniref:uncharacterized protein LOC135502042 isoform X2 n=1 Tax=Lineus longissimus TaxID=88925 RepID=UPI00315D4371
MKQTVRSTKMSLVRILTLGVGLVLLIPNVNCSATCQEKYLDGQTPDTKHIVTVGEKITLKCDLSAVNETTDVVYWKNDEAVMSEDDGVIPKFQSKFNVSYGKNAKGILLYTISWIAELDDAGSYNCTCSTGGIRFRVWIRRPCNKRENVRQTNTTTSPVVLNYLKTNKSYPLQANTPLNFKIGLDCNCTWPEVNRTFQGKWYGTSTDDPGSSDPLPSLSVNGTQDSTKTPIGCYTGKGSVTYRYRNVFGSFANVEFKCPTAEIDKTYNFYIDEVEEKKPEEFTTIMSISCKASYCENYELHFVLIGAGIFVFIYLVFAIAMGCLKQKDAKKQINTKRIFITLLIVGIIAVLGVALGLGGICTKGFTREALPPPVGTLVGIIIVIILAIVAIIVSILFLCWLKKTKAPKGNHMVKGQENPNFSDIPKTTDSRTPPPDEGETTAPTNTKLAHPNIQKDYENVLPHQRKKETEYDNILPGAQHRNAKICTICCKNPVQVYFKPCKHVAVCNSCAKSMQDKAENTQANCPVCRIPVTDFQTLCMVCLENPILGYLTPCLHEVVCKSCATELMKKSVAFCPYCNKEVFDYNL